MYNEPVKIDATIFAQRLKTLREEHGVNKATMARDLDIPASSLSYYEAGLSVPSSDKLFLIADYLNSSIDYLLGRIDKAVDTMSTEKDIAETITRFADFEGIELKENDDGHPVLAFQSDALDRYFSNRLAIERLKKDASSMPIPDEFFNTYNKSLLENEKYYLRDLSQIPLQPKFKPENGEIRRKRRTAKEREALRTPAENDVAESETNDALSK